MAPNDQPSPWSAPGQPQPPPPPPSPTAPPGAGYPSPPPPPPPPPAPYGGQGYASAPFQPRPFPAGGSWAPAKPPRPATPIAGTMLIVGSVIMVLGTVIPWATDGTGSYNGWDIQDFDSESSVAGGFVFIAVVLVGFGITTVAAKRLLPIAILAVIVAAFGIFAALGQLIDLLEFDQLFGYDVGAGLWVVLVGAALALAGAIWTLSVRRRWPAPAPTS